MNKTYYKVYSYSENLGWGMYDNTEYLTKEEATTALQRWVAILPRKYGIMKTTITNDIIMIYEG